LYSQTYRVKDFIQLARETRALIKDLKKSPEWRRIASMGRLLQPGELLFSESGADVIEFDGARPANEMPNRSRIGDEARFKKPLHDLAVAYEEIRKDSRFLAEFDNEVMQTSGHPAPLELAHRLSEHVGGAQIYLKRADMGNHLSHITNVIVGQALLAKRMGKKTLVAASHNGRSGVLLSSIAARMGLKAVVFMHAEQIQIQRSNVFRMWLSGTDVQEVDPRSRVGADIRKAAFEHWARFADDTFLVMGLDAGPHPYPMMMQEFTSLIGRECRRQIHAHIRKAPDILVTRAGENADAIGLFPSFLKAAATRLVCVGAEDSFTSVDAATIIRPGSAQHVLSTREEKNAARIMEGMDYPSVARETAWLKASGRVEFVKTQTAAAKKAILDLSRCEGIVPAIETSYALAWACQTAATMSREQNIVVFMGENVEKDIWEIGKAMGVPL
jgi:tryptophan synthase beta chain